MKTRSYPNGSNEQFNELRFDDTAGSEHVYLQAQKWMDFRVKSTFKEWIGGTYNTYVAGKTLVQTNDEMHLTSKGDMRLISKDGYDRHRCQAGHRVVTDAALFLQGTDQITLKAPLICGDADDIQFQGKKIVITGSDYVDLKCGGSFVSIKPDGVYIKGSMVYVNSGGSAEKANAVVSATLDDPKCPAIAMNSAGGQKSAPPAARTKPTAYSGQASAFKVAAGGGSPLVTPCDGC